MVGTRHAQEVAADVAMDRCGHMAVGLDVEVPAGEFYTCVAILDTTSFESDKHAGDTKRYCPGTGIVVDEDPVLAACSTSDPAATDSPSPGADR